MNIKSKSNVDVNDLPKLNPKMMLNFISNMTVFSVKILPAVGNSLRRQAKFI